MGPEIPVNHSGLAELIIEWRTSFLWVVCTLNEIARGWRQFATFAQVSHVSLRLNILTETLPSRASTWGGDSFSAFFNHS